MQDLLSALENQKAELEVVELSGPPRVEQATDLAEEVATMSQKSVMNASKLKRQKSRLEKRVDKVATFRELQKEVKDWLADMAGKIDELPPVSGDPETAKEQLKETKVNFPRYRAAGQNVLFELF